MSPAESNNPDSTHTPPDLIIAPRWIIPVEPANTVLTEHVIAIARGKILAIETREQARTLWPGVNWEERPDHVLIPGLINAHTSMNASFATQMPEAGGISVISQSGALCTAILDWAAARHLGKSV